MKRISLVSFLIVILLLFVNANNNKKTDMKYSSESFYMLKEKEESLKLEDWMLDSNVFVVNIFENEEEEPLIVEDWMLNSFN